MGDQALTKKIMKALASTGQRAIIQRGWAGLGVQDDDAPMPPNIHVIDSVPHDYLFPRCSAVVHHGSDHHALPSACPATRGSCHIEYVMIVYVCARHQATAADKLTWPRAGGAGTTAAGLHAECPTTVVPFFGDQSFWGEVGGFVPARLWLDSCHARFQLANPGDTIVRRKPSEQYMTQAVRRAGVGPKPIPIDSLSRSKLVHALKFMARSEVNWVMCKTAPCRVYPARSSAVPAAWPKACLFLLQVKRKAVRLAGHIRKENGVEAGVQSFFRHAFSCLPPAFVRMRL